MQNDVMQREIMPAIRRSISAAGLLKSGASLVAAVSGGADSLALLMGLVHLREEIPFRLSAVHVEHGLRGQASLDDAAFVEDVCKQLGVPLLLYHAELAGSMHDAGAEARAREARRHFYAEAMDACKAHALLTAHHQGDQAETVLMRLLRGAGTRGLGGIRACADFGQGLMLRPFLALPAITLKEALRGALQPWREDESNAEPCTLRNQLRLRVFPLLHEFQPRAEAHMAQAAQRMQWDEDCLSDMAAELLTKARCPYPFEDGMALFQKPIADAPKAVALRALRAWVESGLACSEHAISYEDSLRLYGLVLSGERNTMNLPGDLCALKTDEYLHLMRQDGSALTPAKLYALVQISQSRQDYALGRFSFVLERHNEDDTIPNGRKAVLLTSTLLERGLFLRTPCPGDWIHPFGAPGSKPLRRYLTDRKLDEPFRAAWPVLACGDEVIWVAGSGASERTRVCAGDEGEIWRLEWEE